MGTGQGGSGTGPTRSRQFTAGQWALEPGRGGVRPGGKGRRAGEEGGLGLGQVKGGRGGRNSWSRLI